MPRRLSKDERVHAIDLWYRHHDVTLVLQKWELPHRPDRRTIRALVRRFQDTGGTADRARSGRPRTANTPAIRERVERDVQNSPTQSIRQRMPNLRMSYGSTQRIIQSLGFTPYRLQSSHFLFDQDYGQRRQFCQWFLTKTENDPLFVDQEWYSDESRTNPHYHVEIPNSRRGLNIWCAISSLGLVGPIIYDGTMTQDKYRQMLQREFLPVRRELDPEGTSWLMQDGAPAHTANETVETLQELEQMIREAVASLSQEKIQDVCRSVVSRC
ncbi:putative Transposable element Tc3 transposase [Blattamonas nauphoetae]|uniref:Transposable element Tc3 transposase n=1 Tax=Blattamonas nauphoetae TaxID=2049346 RepID=A0ABQ9Y115_9EUKA|nr:putative Transposable element Tc3 transposase [Blattamonas nauphoetae]